MERRTFFVMGSATVMVAASGCIDQIGNTVTGNDNPNLPGGMEVDTLYEVGDVLEDGYHTMESEEDHHVVIENPETAEEKIAATDESITSFVADTNFDESYLLIVQNGMQSSPDLELAAIERENDGIHVEISVDPPDQDIDDDIASHSLLIRITDEEAEVPETVSVDIDGYV